MNIIDELAECRRRALCDVLDTLGADGVSAWHNGTVPDDLMREVWEHVRWLESRARWSALEDAAKFFHSTPLIAGRIRSLQPQDI